MGGKRKLTGQEVINLRKDRRDGAKVKYLSEKYNVAKSTVVDISCGRLYKNIDGPICTPKCTSGKLKEKEVIELRYEIKMGAKQEDLSKKYGVHKSIIGKASRGKIHKNVGGYICGKGKLSGNEVVSLRKKYAKGVLQKILSKKYNIHESTVGDIVRGISHKKIGGPISKKRTGFDRRKVSKELFFKIRDEYWSTKMTYKKLSDKYKLYPSTIARIMTAETAMVKSYEEYLNEGR
jgi:ribosome-binding protein aMBF1 (putative translation factor)